MNLDDLTKSFEANRVPILATAGAGVVAFALLQRRKAAAAGPAPAQGVTTTPGVYSAGGQVAGANGAAAYDSTSSDVYGLVQPQLESLGGQLSDLSSKLNAVPVSAPPAAASMYQPNYTGSYVRYGNGTIAEIESDGSLFGFTPEQWWGNQQTAHATPIPISSPQPTVYTTGGNLAVKNPAPAPSST